MVIRLVGAARLVDGQVDVRVQPAFVDKQHPLAKVDGAFNAVMLQGDAIREITLEGPGAGGVETASAVIADITSVIGTMGTGSCRTTPRGASCRRCPTGDSPRRSISACTSRTGPGALARVAEELAEREISIARLLQQRTADGAALHVVTHEARVRRARGGARRGRTAAPTCTAARRRARHLRPRRRGARMGVSAASALSLGEGLDAARARRAACTERLGSSST